MRCHCKGAPRPRQSVPRPPAGAFRAPARVSFFWCQKKDTKENHSDLRSKNPLARGDTSLADDPTSRPRQFPGFSPVQRTVPRSLSSTASLPLPGATVGPYSSVVSGRRGRRPLRPPTEPFRRGGCPRRATSAFDPRRAASTFRHIRPTRMTPLPGGPAPALNSRAVSNQREIVIFHYS